MCIHYYRIPDKDTNSSSINNFHINVLFYFLMLVSNSPSMSERDSDWMVAMCLCCYR